MIIEIIEITCDRASVDKGWRVCTTCSVPFLTSKIWTGIRQAYSNIIHRIFISVESQNPRIVMLRLQGKCISDLSLWHSSDPRYYRPWPYIDSLTHDLASEHDANTLNVIGSCGHDDCQDCHQWTAYPQSHFGNWTKKPVQKCGIEWAVKDRENPSTIYTVDILANGVFGASDEYVVTSENKRDYWNRTLLPEVSHIDTGIIVRSRLTRLSAWAWNSRARSFHQQDVRSCPTDARL